MSTPHTAVAPRLLLCLPVLQQIVVVAVGCSIGNTKREKNKKEKKKKEIVTGH